MESKYVIGGGLEGKNRLNVLSDALRPYTLSLLKMQRLAEGQTFFDVGCGGGAVTLLAADIVGPQGTATGIDFDEVIIDLAKQDALKASYNNTTFMAKDVCEMDVAEQYDFVYSRFLLSHLQNPRDILQKMVRSAKPGGKVVVEDTHFSGHLCYPACKSFDRYVELFMKASFNNGHNPEIGCSLYSLFQDAGLTNVGFDVVLPCFNTGRGKWMAYLTLDRIKDTLISQGLATTEEFRIMLEEIESFTIDERTIMSLPHIFRAWGVRTVR